MSALLTRLQNYTDSITPSAHGSASQCTCYRVQRVVKWTLPGIAEARLGPPGVGGQSKPGRAGRGESVCQEEVSGVRVPGESAPEMGMQGKIQDTPFSLNFRLIVDNFLV